MLNAQPAPRTVLMRSPASPAAPIKSSNSSSRSTDPLDTDGDGTVSAQQNAAGALKALVKAAENFAQESQLSVAA